MATPSLAMIPSAYADSKVYSVLPNNGDGDFTFNRDSSATRVGQNGLIQTVGFFGNELITNGSFDTDSDWTKGTGWTISGGKASSDGSQTGNSNLYQAISFTVGKQYKVSYEVSNFSSGTIKIVFGDTGGVLRSANGNYIEYFTFVSGSNFFIQANSSFTGSIDNVSVKEVTGDQPRLNYDISNGVVQSCPSLLLEGASTNLITYSEDFSNAYWIKTEATVTLNTTTSPDGSLNASKLTPSTINSNHKIASGSVPIVSSLTSYWFVKSNGYSKVSLREDAAVGEYASFDLSQGIVLDSSTSSKIEDYGNGWFRIELNDDLTNVTARNSLYVLPDSYISGSPNLVNWSADGTSSIFIWGAQSEEGSYSTSYIPTNGASQTRAAETCNDAGTASTFNSTEGVLYAEIAAISNSTSTAVFSINDGTSSNTLYVGFPTSSNVIQTQLVVGGATQTNMNHNVSDRTSFNKVAVLYQNNNHKMFINGVEVETDTSGSVPSANTFDRVNFDLGQGSFDFYGNCKDLRVYNEALTDAQLIALTT